MFKNNSPRKFLNPTTSNKIKIKLNKKNFKGKDKFHICKHFTCIKRGRIKETKSFSCLALHTFFVFSVRY